jgi:hypothetical protein
VLRGVLAGAAWDTLQVLVMEPRCLLAELKESEDGASPSPSVAPTEGDCAFPSPVLPLWLLPLNVMALPFSSLPSPSPSPSAAPLKVA